MCLGVRIHQQLDRSPVLPTASEIYGHAKPGSLIIGLLKELDPEDTASLIRNVDSAVRLALLWWLVSWLLYPLLLMSLIGVILTLAGGIAKMLDSASPTIQFTAFCATLYGLGFLSSTHPAVTRTVRGMRGIRDECHLRFKVLREVRAILKGDRTSV